MANLYSVFSTTGVGEKVRLGKTRSNTGNLRCRWATVCVLGKPCRLTKSNRSLWSRDLLPSPTLDQDILRFFANVVPGIYLVNDLSIVILSLPTQILASVSHHFVSRFIIVS